MVSVLAISNSPTAIMLIATIAMSKIIPLCSFIMMPLMHSSSSCCCCSRTCTINTSSERIRSSASIRLGTTAAAAASSSEEEEEEEGASRFNENEDIDEETLLRFQGVGRLYEKGTTTTNNHNHNHHNNNHQHTQESNTSKSYKQILHKLQQSTVAIIGIGGVGSWTAESICRSGVGSILLLDLDDVCISNTNRQLHATSTNIGKMKIDVMKQRLLDINPNVNVTCIHEFITEDNVFDIVQTFRDEYNVNVIIDAIDGNAEKAALIAASCVKGVPIVTCGGAAGRIDPTQIVCQDLSISIECKLLFWTKKKLRNQYRLFPNDMKKKTRRWRIPAIFSLEAQKKLDLSDGNDDTSSFRKCDGGLGTACFVTGTYGMIAASQVVNMIVHDSYQKPRLIRSSVKYWNEKHENKKMMKKKNDDDDDDDDHSQTNNDVLESFIAD